MFFSFSSNQEEMLGSIQEKRLQFEDSAKLQEIQSLVMITVSDITV